MCSGNLKMCTTNFWRDVMCPAGFSLEYHCNTVYTNFTISNFQSKVKECSKLHVNSTVMFQLLTSLPIRALPLDPAGGLASPDPLFSIVMTLCAVGYSSYFRLWLWLIAMVVCISSVNFLWLLLVYWWLHLMLIQIMLYYYLWLSQPRSCVDI